MSNECEACQAVMDEYLKEHPSPTGGGNFNPVDFLCDSHKEEFAEQLKP